MVEVVVVELAVVVGFGVDGDEAAEGWIVAAVVVEVTFAAAPIAGDAEYENIVAAAVQCFGLVIKFPAVVAAAVVFGSATLKVEAAVVEMDILEDEQRNPMAKNGHEKRANAGKAASPKPG